MAITYVANEFIHGTMLGPERNFSVVVDVLFGIFLRNGTTWAEMTENRGKVVLLMKRFGSIGRKKAKGSRRDSLNDLGKAIALIRCVRTVVAVRFVDAERGPIASGWACTGRRAQRRRMHRRTMAVALAVDDHRLRPVKARRRDRPRRRHSSAVHDQLLLVGTGFTGCSVSWWKTVATLTGNGCAWRSWRKRKGKICIIQLGIVEHIQRVLFKPS